MIARAKLWIDGEWVTPEGRWEKVRNPNTGETIAEVPLADAGWRERALAAAVAAFPKARARPRFERAALLLAVAAGLERRKAEFAETIVAEAGKPLELAETEVSRAVQTFTCAAEEARRFQGELLPLDGTAGGAEHHGLTGRFPLGVIAAVCPFNFPLNLVAHKVAPALATGNCLVVKPALKTPLTALLLAEVLEEAGVPGGEANFLLCANEEVEAIVSDYRVKMLSFTGSDAVGWRLKERCARKRVTLELGGNAAVLVHEDADLAAAIPAIATGAFAYAGQSCISVQRVLVHEAKYAEFREALRDHVISQVKTGDPRERGVLVGPMITEEALRKTMERIAAAEHGGASVLVRGARDGFRLGPTVLERVAPTAELWTEEAFAPVMALDSYADFSSALARVNESRYGLQAGVFTRDQARAWEAFQELEVGGVTINEAPTWRADPMPYGGVKASGFGREGVRSAMEEMTEPRTLIFRL